jgi:hypothetical protein
LQTFKLSIPVHIPEDIDVKDKDVFEVPLTFYGPKGSSFGQKLVLKVKVNEGSYELRFYKTAITMMEAGLGTFDECTEVLRKCNGDENAAVLMMIDKNNEPKT